jgi:hypothetical protein
MSASWYPTHRKKRDGWGTRPAATLALFGVTSRVMKRSETFAADRKSAYFLIAFLSALAASLVLAVYKVFL